MAKDELEIQKSTKIQQLQDRNTVVEMIKTDKNKPFNEMLFKPGCLGKDESELMDAGLY